jgi:hypothetical protein
LAAKEPAPPCNPEEEEEEEEEDEETGLPDHHQASMPNSHLITLPACSSSIISGGEVLKTHHSQSENSN